MPRSSTSSPQNIVFALLVLFWFFFWFYFGWLTTLSSISTRKGMCMIVLDHVMYLGKKMGLLRAHNKPFCISNSKHDADLFLKHSCYSGRDCDQDRLDGSAWLHTSRAGDGFARKCACNTDDFKYGKCKNVSLWISGLLKKQMHKVSTDKYGKQTKTDATACFRGINFAPKGVSSLRLNREQA